MKGLGWGTTVIHRIRRVLLSSTTQPRSRSVDGIITIRDSVSFEGRRKMKLGQVNS